MGQPFIHPGLYFDDLVDEAVGLLLDEEEAKEVTWEFPFEQGDYSDGDDSDGSSSSDDEESSNDSPLWTCYSYEECDQLRVAG